MKRESLQNHLEDITYHYYFLVLNGTMQNIICCTIIPSITSQSDGTGSDSGGSFDIGPRTQTSDSSIISGIDVKLGASLTDMNAVRLDIIDEKLSTRLRIPNSSNYIILNTIYN